MGARQNPAEFRPRVWITRAEPGASGTARRLDALGFTPLVAPLLSFRALDAEVSLNPGEALAFTSINGVQHTATLLHQRDMRVFAVGDATAEAARAAGFSDVNSAGGDVADLSTLINQSGWSGGVLHPCAKQTAGDLVGALRANGLQARKVAIYETSAATVLPTPVIEALENHAILAVLFHSPKAARAAADLLTPSKNAFRTVMAIGLSQACVDPLRQSGFRATLCPHTPTEDALIALLADLNAKGPGDG